MAVIPVKGFLQDDAVVWELRGNQLEFTLSEFRDLIASLGKKRLFSYLREERPALLSQIQTLYADRIGSDEEEKELEYLLESCLFGFERKIRVTGS